MSKEDGIKKLVYSAIITMVATGVFSVIALVINIRVSNAIVKSDVTKLKEQSMCFANKSDVNATFSALSSDIQENKSDIKIFNNKVDEIKDLILDLHTK